jgi:hypothetical protein
MRVGQERGAEAQNAGTPECRKDRQERGAEAQNAGTPECRAGTRTRARGDDGHDRQER